MVQPGEQVELVDARSGKLLKVATVKGVHVGPLDQMAQQHAHAAHNWKTFPLEERPSLLVHSLSKRYRPGRVKADSLVTVFDLEADDDSE